MKEWTFSSSFKWRKSLSSQLQIIFHTSLKSVCTGRIENFFGSKSKVKYLIVVKNENLKKKAWPMSFCMSETIEKNHENKKKRNLRHSMAGCVWSDNRKFQETVEFSFS